jgi:hypothetical protein
VRPDVYTYRMCHIFTQGSTRGRVYFFTQGSCIFWLIKQLPNSERIGALSRPGRPVLGLFSRAARPREEIALCSRVFGVYDLDPPGRGRR